MGKVQYDFRLGINQDRIVYKNDKWDWKSTMYYLLYMLFTWAYLVGWFCAFEYSYINHQRIAFWVYIGCWLAFIGVFISFAIINLAKAHQKKKKKQAKARMIQEELKRKEEEENRLREEMKRPQRHLSSEANVLVEH
jgi:type VI protein secretion system component VasK